MEPDEDILTDEELTSCLSNLAVNGDDACVDTEYQLKAFRELYSIRPYEANRFKDWALEFELDEQAEQDIDRIMDACDELERGMESKDN